MAWKLSDERLNELRLMSIEELKKVDKEEVSELSMRLGRTDKNSPLYDEELVKAYDVVRNRRKNYIFNAVNNKATLEDYGISDPYEILIYKYLWQDSLIHEIVYGSWPYWDDCLELDYDEIPDIYPDDFNDKVIESLRNKK